MLSTQQVPFLPPDEQTQLRSLAASRTLPHALVARAKLVLWAAAGQSNTQIARRLRWTNATVGKWRQRFVRYAKRQPCVRNMAKGPEAFAGLG